jgi:hypothetical protein
MSKQKAKSEMTKTNFYFFRLESVPVKSCSPSRCQTEVEEEKIIIISDGDEETRESLNRVRDDVRDDADQVRDYTVPFRGDVDQVRDNVDQVRDNVNIVRVNVDQVRDNAEQVRANVDQVRNTFQEYAVPFRGDVDRIRALCDNDDDDDVSTRSFEFETVCKNYVPRNCDPDVDDCRPKEVCYKKPRLVRDASDEELRARCREKRYPD